MHHAAGSPQRHLEQWQFSRICNFATAWLASNNCYHSVYRPSPFLQQLHENIFIIL